MGSCDEEAAEVDAFGEVNRLNAKFCIVSGSISSSSSSSSWLMASKTGSSVSSD
jgi:hypothetical protein